MFYLGRLAGRYKGRITPLLLQITHTRPTTGALRETQTYGTGRRTPLKKRIVMERTRLWMVCSLLLMLLLSTTLNTTPTLFAKKKNDVGLTTARFATYQVNLTQDDIFGDPSDPEESNGRARAIAEIIQREAPHVLLLSSFAYDEDEEAIKYFKKHYLQVSQNGAAPIKYDHITFAPNTGDEDGDTAGSPGMVLLSQYKIKKKDVRTFNDFPWAAMPDNAMPAPPTDPTSPTNSLSATEPPTDTVAAALSTIGHWDVPIAVNGQTIHVLASNPIWPDEQDPQSVARNHDEIRFWADYITPGADDYIVDDDGDKGGLSEDDSVVILGTLNSDPRDYHAEAIRQLTEHERIDNTTIPLSYGAYEQAKKDGGANKAQGPRKYAKFDTADLADKGKNAPGNLRLDYVLPSSNRPLASAEVFWKTENNLFHPLMVDSDTNHRLVWGDVIIEPPDDEGTRPDIPDTVIEGEIVEIPVWLLNNGKIVGVQINVNSDNHNLLTPMCQKRDDVRDDLQDNKDFPPDEAITHVACNPADGWYYMMDLYREVDPPQDIRMLVSLPFRVHAVEEEQCANIVFEETILVNRKAEREEYRVIEDRICVQPKTGDVAGKVFLQSSKRVGGIEVALSNGDTTYTENDGSFRFEDVKPGVYKVDVLKRLFVNAERDDITVLSAEETEMEDIGLWAGDMDNTRLIDDDDWRICSAKSIPVNDPDYDLNDDDSTDIQDCTIVVNNIGRDDVDMTTMNPDEFYRNLVNAAGAQLAALANDARQYVTVDTPSATETHLTIGEGYPEDFYTSGVRVGLGDGMTVEDVQLANGASAPYLDWHQEGTTLYVVVDMGGAPIAAGMELVLTHTAGAGDVTVEAANLVRIASVSTPDSLYLPLVVR